jgi:hypothetical protein
MEVQKNLNTRDAAVYLQNQCGIPVTPGTMEVWRCLGRGPRFRKVARWVLYAPMDLDRFAAGQTVETVDSLERV